MVSSRYLLEKPPPPSALKRFFDQRLMPGAIDMAGSCEVVLEDVARRVRHHPLGATALVCGAGWVLGFLGSNHRNAGGHSRPSVATR